MIECPDCGDSTAVDTSDGIHCSNCGPVTTQSDSTISTESESTDPKDADDTVTIKEPTTESVSVLPLVGLGLVVLVVGGLIFPLVGIPLGMFLLFLAFINQFK